MTARERILTTLSHRAPDRVPIDLGGTTVTGMHVSCVAALRKHLGLDAHPVKVVELMQMLGEIEDDLKDALGIDTAPAARPSTKWGFPAADWKPWRMPDGLEVLVPGRFNFTTAANGDILMHPQGDTSAPPSGRMPRDGYFFDSIIRQDPIDEEKLNPEDNLEEFGPVPDADFVAMRQAAERTRAAGRAVIAAIGGTGFGDIANVPAPGLRHPKGIRDIAEWYMAIRLRRPYVYRVFEKQAEIAVRNLERLNAAMGSLIDVIYLCGTDFGTQTSSFCSEATFRELWYPHYKTVNTWIHKNTGWRVFKHSCGAVSKFIPAFIEAGFDILNPVQCSAAGMEPKELKQRFGDQIVFWGGGVDTQKTLPFLTPEAVREEALRRLDAFAPGGGYVFNAVHNIQAQTPVENIMAFYGAVREFNG